MDSFSNSVFVKHIYYTSLFVGNEFQYHHCSWATFSKSTVFRVLFSSPARHRHRHPEKTSKTSGQMDNMPHRQLVPRHRPGDKRNALRILQLTDIHQFPTGATEWYCKGKGKCFVWSCLCPATSKEACVLKDWTVIHNGVSKLPTFRLLFSGRRHVLLFFRRRNLISTLQWVSVQSCVVTAPLFSLLRANCHTLHALSVSYVLSDRVSALNQHADACALCRAIIFESQFFGSCMFL